jgi:predicted nuclease of restriction endonuclease-like (RecB) superfamily
MVARKKTTVSPSLPDGESIIPRDYADWLASLKPRISCARQRAALAVNQELVQLYHHIGTEILERQTRQGWGAKVIDRLAADLREAFPEMKGFSSRNLKYMKFFAQMCPAGLIGQQPAAQLPWFHIVTLLTKVSGDTEREWYAGQAIQHGWSRPTLDVHIKNQLHLRQGVAITNFDRQLPAPHAQLAIEALKDPYLFDFLGLGDEALERDIENALIRHITRFLLELGAGFAFVGRQFRLEVGGRPDQGPGRQAHHRPLALQDQESPRSRICPFRDRQAHRRGGIPTRARTARTAGYQSAEH